MNVKDLRIGKVYKDRFSGSAFMYNGRSYNAVDFEFIEMEELENGNYKATDYIAYFDKFAVTDLVEE